MIDCVASLRKDNPEVFNAETRATLAKINEHVTEMSTILQHSSLPPNVVKVLEADVKAAQTHLRSVEDHYDWKLGLALLVGRLGISAIQMSGSIFAKEWKSCAIFIAHQSKSLVLVAGLLRRSTTHSGVIRDHFARRDTFLGFQAAFFLPRLIPIFFPKYKLLGQVFNHTGYRVAITALSVLAAAYAIFPRDIRALLNRTFKGDSEPELVDVAMDASAKRQIVAYRDYAEDATELVGQMRVDFKDTPSDSTDWVVGSVLRAFLDAGLHSSTLLREPPHALQNPAWGQKMVVAAVTTGVAAFPIPFLAKANPLGLTGVIANALLAGGIQVKNAMDSSKTLQSSVDNFRMFCAFTMLMGPIFGINSAMGDPMGKSAKGMGVFATIFGVVGNTVPVMIVLGLMNGAMAAWRYLTPSGTRAAVDPERATPAAPATPPATHAVTSAPQFEALLKNEWVTGHEG